VNVLNKINKKNKCADVDACSGTDPDELTAESGTIQSPGYAESAYPSYSRCLWRITAPSGYVSTTALHTHLPDIGRDVIILFSAPRSLQSSNVILLLARCLKGKGGPYSIAERRVPELIPVLGSQSCTVFICQQSYLLLRYLVFHHPLTLLFQA